MKDSRIPVMGRDVQQQTDSSQRGLSNLMEKRERDVEEEERASKADGEEERRLPFYTFM